MPDTIVLAGATGDLGGRIARALIAGDAHVRAIVRPTSDGRRIAALKRRGVEVVTVAGSDLDGLSAACAGATCLVSALSGLRDVIVDAQLRLARAAAKAKVKRFIPSDYCIDFSRLPTGSNRNLDLRRELWSRLEDVPIRPTSILSGAFADLLTGQMPMLVFPLKQVVYWGDADQRMDFTTRDNAAAYTAAAALDRRSPRVLRIAGIEISPYELCELVSDVTSERFSLFRAGGLGALKAMVKVTRTLQPGGDALYPAWQGMQYMHNMLGGRAKFLELDNDRYGGITWTTARDVVSRHVRARRAAATREQQESAAR